MGPVPIAIFHSVYGLRPVESAAAERLRRFGHPVHLPDLFGGVVADGPDGTPTFEAGFAIQERVGWDTIMERATAAIRDLPPETVLVGFSMGVGVIANLWPDRLRAAAVLLLHSTCEVPDGIPAGTPMQTHVAVGDPFAPTDRLDRFTETAARAGADATCFTYPNAGHYYTDPSLADHDVAAASLTWRRVEDLLRTLPTG